MMLLSAFNFLIHVLGWRDEQDLVNSPVLKGFSNRRLEELGEQNPDVRGGLHRHHVLEGGEKVRLERVREVVAAARVGVGACERGRAKRGGSKGCSKGAHTDATRAMPSETKRCRTSQPSDRDMDTRRATKSFCQFTSASPRRLIRAACACSDPSRTSATSSLRSE